MALRSRVSFLKKKLLKQYTGPSPSRKLAVCMLLRMRKSTIVSLRNWPGMRQSRSLSSTMMQSSASGGYTTGALSVVWRDALEKKTSPSTLGPGAPSSSLKSTVSGSRGRIDLCLFGSFDLRAERLGLCEPYPPKYHERFLALLRGVGLLPRLDASNRRSGTEWVCARSQSCQCDAGIGTH